MGCILHLCCFIFLSPSVWAWKWKWLPTSIYPPSSSSLPHLHSPAPPPLTQPTHCWHHAYNHLLSTCTAILKDQELKGRLAYHLTSCFLRLTARPPLPPCPQTSPITACTASLTHHLHSIYLAFLLDAASMCHHLQNEAFKAETEKVVSNLKGSTYWLVDKLKNIEAQSGKIFNDFLQQSESIEGKLKSMECRSQAIIEQSEKMEDKLKGMKDASKAIFEQSDQIIHMQSKFGEEHGLLHRTVAEGMMGLHDAAKETHERLHGVAETQRQIAQQQLRLAGDMVAQIGAVQERVTDISSSVGLSVSRQEQLSEEQDTLIAGQGDAIQSLKSLQNLQASAVEETRLSLESLAEAARKNQLDFKVWQLELDQLHQRLNSGSQALLKTQEEFLSKQSAIFTTLDHLFHLYNTILLESRALKTLLFYGVSAIFAHLLTGTKQTSKSRSLVYAGLCVSLGVELWLVKMYGKITLNQSWIQSRTYWTRSVFGGFVLSAFLYCLLTYRDIALRNNEILLDLHRKLGSQLKLKQGASSDPEFRDIKQCQDRTLVGEILQMASKFIKRMWKRGKRLVRRRRREDVDDALSNWMRLRGIDTVMLEGDGSSDGDERYDPSMHFHGGNDNSGAQRHTTIRSAYNLRSQCGRGSYAHCTLRHSGIYALKSL